VGIDSWNLDFGLVDEEGRLLANPISYRDQSAGWVAEEIVRRLSPLELYRQTGMPVYPITGLTRLIQMGRDSRRRLLELARYYLPIPDLVRFFLTGEASIEQTISWGTQLVDVGSRSWSRELIERFAIPRWILPEIVPPGSAGGTLSQEISSVTGLEPCPVVPVAEHDTASAVLAAGLLDHQAAFLSVGTWSILGALLDRPLVTEEACRLGFMNEIGYPSILLAKNLMGFYLLEEFLKSWREAGRACDYDTLIRLARAAPPGGLQLDPNDPLFYAPPNVEAVLAEYCRKTGQGPYEDQGVIARAVFEGLAASYARALGELAGLTKRQFSKVVMVGGGVRNVFFCGLVAKSCGVEVVAGPAEATVVGNLCVQAMALGKLPLEQLGAVVAASFPTAG
jgi:sugar (pentulose or hexulose) kinase